MSFAPLRRRAADVQARIASGQPYDPIRPAVQAIHRGGHALVARELGLSFPPGEAGSRPCPGVARLLRRPDPARLAVIVAGQAAECLALGVRFADKLRLAPDLARVPEADLRPAWRLARTILRRHLEELARCV